MTNFRNNKRQRHKLLRGLGASSSGKYLNFSPQSPLSYISESFRQDIGYFLSPQIKPCELAENVQTIFEISSGKLRRFLLNVRAISALVTKNLTDFCKTVETGMDLRLLMFHLARLLIDQLTSVCHFYPL